MLSGQDGKGLVTGSSRLQRPSSDAGMRQGGGVVGGGGSHVAAARVLRVWGTGGGDMTCRVGWRGQCLGKARCISLDATQVPIHNPVHSAVAANNVLFPAWLTSKRVTLNYEHEHV